MSDLRAGSARSEGQRPHQDYLSEVRFTVRPHGIERDAVLFGYVTVNQYELKIRDYKRYRSFYCGLCRSLQKRFGIRGQVILPYDMVFVDILLNGLYEIPLDEEDRFCAAHPSRKQHMVSNEITDYAADMGILLKSRYLQKTGPESESGMAQAGESGGRVY